MRVDDQPDGRAPGLRTRLAALAADLRGCIGDGTEVGADQLGQGVYVTETDVARAFEELAWLSVPDETEEDGPNPFGAVVESLGLTPFEQTAVVSAVAPDVDRAFGTIYAYINDDVALRRSTVLIVQRLAGLPPLPARMALGLGAQGRLARAGLLVPDTDAATPLPRRQVRLADRVVAFLLGDDGPDPAVAGCELVAVGVPSAEATEAAKTLVDRQPPLTYVRESEPGTAITHATAIVEAAGGVAIVVDLTDRGEPGPGIARAALREALLRQRCLVIAGLDVLVEQDRTLLDAIATSPVPVIGTGRRMWPQDRPADVPLLIDAPEIPAEARAAIWQSLVPDCGDELVAEVAKFRIAPERIPAAARAAVLDASRRGVALDVEAAHHAIRVQNTGELDRLARRITPRASLDDLVLPRDLQAQVAEIARWVGHRDTVEDVWGMGGKGTRGRGITALFAGPSGTGKTLTAEAVAAEIGVDLYTIDLATVVSKYIGETEKNLERVFTGAEGVNAVLFFDEADALFGKRSETSDAHDRYANIEVSYLLQRMEQFDGISILASNLRANIDEAFARRLDFVLSFPIPDAEARRRLWDAHLPGSAPRAPDIDTTELARRFELAGGDIRNATLAAAYSAAATGREIGMEQLVRAVAREYDKLGRLVAEDDFGPWAAAVGDV